MTATLDRLESMLDERVTTVEGFTVEAGKVEEFARAVGDDDPVYRDAAVAEARGFEAVPAPLSFVRTADFPRYRTGREVDLGFRHEHTLHGEQAYEYDRPLVVASNRQPYSHTYDGDEITVERPVGGLTAVGSLAAPLAGLTRVFERSYTGPVYSDGVALVDDLLKHGLKRFDHRLHGRVLRCDELLAEHGALHFQLDARRPQLQQPREPAPGELQAGAEELRADDDPQQRADPGDGPAEQQPVLAFEILILLEVVVMQGQTGQRADHDRCDRGPADLRPDHGRDPPRQKHHHLH